MSGTIRVSANTSVSSGSRTLLNSVGTDGTRIDADGAKLFHIYPIFGTFLKLKASPHNYYMRMGLVQNFEYKFSADMACAHTWVHHVT